MCGKAGLTGTTGINIARAQINGPRVYKKDWGYGGLDWIGPFAADIFVCWEVIMRVVRV